MEKSEENPLPHRYVFLFRREEESGEREAPWPGTMRNMTQEHCQAKVAIKKGNKKIADIQYQLEQPQASAKEKDDCVASQWVPVK